MRNTDRDYINLLYDIGEFSGMIRESTDIQNLLDRTVTMISERLQAEVCSVYLYDEQMRAILRAGADTPRLGLMFPMISSLDEFARARELVMESLHALQREGLPHHAAPALGAMIEVPAVVEIAEELAREADLLSIGTNDFVQYLLGVDRMNEQVAYAYRPEHPSVLRSLNRLTDAAGRAGKEISVCGEMAHDPDLLPFLLGIGILTLSAESSLAGVQTHQCL